MSTTLLSRVREVLSLPTEVYNERGQKWLRVEQRPGLDHVRDYERTLADLRRAFVYRDDREFEWVFVVHTKQGKILGEAEVSLTEAGHTIIDLIPQ